eukprot:2309196-Pyramimonas_sp.AAC.1
MAQRSKDQGPRPTPSGPSSARATSGASAPVTGSHHRRDPGVAPAAGRAGSRGLRGSTAACK